MQNNNHEWLKRCFNCMEPIDEPDAVCANCGWDNHNRENGNAALEQTILKDQYIVGKSLGRGGFGITYVGFDLALDRRIAIKEFFPIGTAYRFGDAVTVRAYTETEEDFQSGLKQAIQESRTTAKLGQIPNVMQVHNVFLENGTVYMIMEYIDGISLGEEVKRNGTLNWREALNLMYPIMNALEKIHAKGLIHRDISPENIIRRKETGEPVLLDFGSARQPKEGLTVMLKPGYAPAEQYSLNSEQDGRVDEYALCATIYYLVTGSAPASADLRLFAKKELKRPSEYAEDIPAEFEKVLLKGMELDSSNRYTSVRELHEAFLETEKAGTGEWKGNGGAGAAGNPGEFENLRDSRNHRSSDDSKSSANSTNGAGPDKSASVSGSDSRKPEPEKKEKRRSSGKIAGVIAAGAVACLGGVLLFGNAGRGNETKEKVVESVAEESEAEEKEKAAVENEATPTPEPTAAPEPTETPTPKPTATPTPKLTSTPTPAPTPEPTATAAPEQAVSSLSDFENTELPIMQTDHDDYLPVRTVLGSKFLRKDITEIVIEKSLSSAPDDAWDVSQKKDGSVLAWITKTGDGNRLTIAGEGGVSAPENSSELFSRYENLRKADLSGLDTSNVTNMRSMFYSCKNLTSIDMSNFDTSKVTNMDSMFRNCESLTSIDVSNLDTSNVIQMSKMFYGCKSLESIDVSNLDTSNANTSDMFYGCSLLPNLTGTLSADSGDTELPILQADYGDVMPVRTVLGSNFLRENITEIIIEKSLTSAPDDAWDVSQKKDRSVLAWVTGTGDGNILTIAGEGGVRAPKNSSEMFSRYENLRKVDLSWLDTSNVTNMRSMFYSCENLMSIDVSNFDTSKVTNMNSMFRNCESLTSINVSNFDTSKVTDMKGLFCSCESLASIDVSNFDTSKVTDMSLMFKDCKSLMNLDVSNFDTSNVMDMKNIFKKSSLEKIYLGESFVLVDENEYEMFDDDFSGKIISTGETLTSDEWVQQATIITGTKKGDKGATVKWLQRVLAKLGYAIGSADGSFGPKTEECLKKFQTGAGLTSSGIVDKATIKALCREISKMAAA